MTNEEQTGDLEDWVRKELTREQIQKVEPSLRFLRETGETIRELQRIISEYEQLEARAYHQNIRCITSSYTIKQ